MKDSKTLIVILGPTAVGKTEVCLRIAERYGIPVISADSRQMYRDIPIGTAAPTEEEQSRAEHFFVGQLSLTDYYSASVYETQALKVIEDCFCRGMQRVLLSGGSMMYLDAVCNGIDAMPDISDNIREQLKAEYREGGLAPLVSELQRLDPDYAQQCDLNNQVRVIHALEICRQTGQPYSSFRKREKGDGQQRPFRILKIGLDRPREELFERINLRVTKMVEQGFVEEARRVLPWREQNSLNTVGFKEIFRYFDGDWPLEMTLDRICKNTRVYAKKQLTWFKRDATITWFHPDQIDQIIEFIDTHS